MNTFTAIIVFKNGIVQITDFETEEAAQASINSARTSPENYGHQILFAHVTNRFKLVMGQIAGDGRLWLTTDDLSPNFGYSISFMNDKS